MHAGRKVWIKSIIPVIHGTRATTGRAIMFCRQDSAEADDQAADKGELIIRLMGIDASAIIVVIVVGAPFCTYR